MDVDVRRPVQRVLVLGVKGRGRRGEPALGALCFRGLAAGWLCTESTSRTSPGPGEASTHHPRKGPVPPRPGAAAWMLAPGVPSDCSAGGEEIRTRVGEAQNCPQGAGPAPPRAGGGAGGREAPPPRPGSRRFRVRVGSRPGASGTSAAEGRAPQAQARWRASARLGAARPQRPELRGRGRGRGDASADPAASAGASQRRPPPGLQSSDRTRKQGLSAAANATGQFPRLTLVFSAWRWPLSDSSTARPAEDFGGLPDRAAAYSGGPSFCCRNAPRGGLGLIPPSLRGTPSEKRNAPQCLFPLVKRFLLLRGHV